MKILGTALASIIGILLISTGVFGQTLVANYDFASAVAGTPCTASALSTATGVTSTFSTGGTGGGTCTTPAGTAVAAPPAFVANANNQAVSLTSFAAGSTNYFQFQLSNVDSFIDYKLFFQAQRSATGPVNADVQWSTDGTTFNTFQTVSPGNGVYSSFNVDLSALPFIENQPTVYFRISGSGGTGVGGTFRIENFQVQAKRPGTLSFSAGAYSGAENSGTIPITMTRTIGSDGAVSVSFSLSNITATGGAACGGTVDYVNPGAQVINWANGDTADKVFNLIVCSDAIAEGTQDLLASIGAATGGATTGSGFVTVSITEPVSLGNYPDTGFVLSDNGIVTPDAAPTFTTGISVKASGGFKGTLTANPATGVVTVTNAHNEGIFPVTVTATGPGGVSTKTFNLTVSASAACVNNINFIQFSSVPSGANPVAIAIGDFNADGNQDLASANSIDGNVSIALGDGAGGFGAAVNFTVGTAPNAIVVGDFNSDGKQDLATANSGSGNVSILTGDGFGGFVATTVAAGTNPTNLAVGDLDNDGDADLAITDTISDSILIRLGNGLGGFTVGTTIVETAGSAPNSVAITDFNNDGNLDLAIANSSLSRQDVTIYFGTGVATFSAGPSVFASSPTSLSVGDFNNDGWQDFVVGSTGSSVTIGRNDGTGGFFFASSFSPGNNSSSVTVSDVNLDGNTDILVANIQSVSVVSLLIGDGAGNFTIQTSPSAPPVDAFMPVGLAIGDFNGDGRQDFAIGSTFTSRIGIEMGSCFFPTAANATISGRVTAANGMPIRNAYVTISGGTLTHPIAALTGSFGTYRLEGVPVGQTYLITIASKRYTFAQPNRVVGVKDDITDFNFVAQP
jgi:hypothetical protein